MAGSWHNQFVYSKRNMWSGALFGIGLAAFLDEVLFHQLLRWHHFYDLATTDIGLISDGLFHAFGWFATIAGLFLLSDIKRRDAYAPLRWWGGLLLGAGSFQLYDGLIQHKWMRIHQIRYVENVWMYDLVWNITAGLMILLGIIFVMKHRQKGVSVHG